MDLGIAMIILLGVIITPIVLVSYSKKQRQKELGETREPRETKE